MSEKNKKNNSIYCGFNRGPFTDICLFFSYYFLVILAVLSASVRLSTLLAVEFSRDSRDVLLVLLSCFLSPKLAWWSRLSIAAHFAFTFSVGLFEAPPGDKDENSFFKSGKENVPFRGNGFE